MSTHFVIIGNGAAGYRAAKALRRADSDAQVSVFSDERYPYRRLFQLLRQSGYQGYCDAEIPASAEPIRLMKYYRACFLALQNVI